MMADGHSRNTAAAIAASSIKLGLSYEEAWPRSAAPLCGDRTSLGFAPIALGQGDTGDHE